jgi:hypothetical protein
MSSAMPMASPDIERIEDADRVFAMVLGHRNELVQHAALVVHGGAAIPRPDRLDQLAPCGRTDS